MAVLPIGDLFTMGIEDCVNAIKLIEPKHVLPSHYAGSVCGRALSGNPFSTVGFERTHNAALRAHDGESFARSLLSDLPPPPPDQDAIVAANRRGSAALPR